MDRDQAGKAGQLASLKCDAHVNIPRSSSPTLFPSTMEEAFEDRRMVGVRRGQVCQTRSTMSWTRQELKSPVDFPSPTSRALALAVMQLHMNNNGDKSCSKPTMISISGYEKPNPNTITPSYHTHPFQYHAIHILCKPTLLPIPVSPLTPIAHTRRALPSTR